MPGISKLNISSLRNICSSELKLSHSFNLIYGENGSGKSSILEAIYLLGHAKSFRSQQYRPIIQFDKTETTIYGELNNGISLGITKFSTKPHRIKVSGISSAELSPAVQLASCLPIQLFNSDTFKILEGSPKTRRQFMDWGVFHVEPMFIKQWHNTQRALQNRNSLLKNKKNKSEVDPWTHELIQYAEKIAIYRQKYIKLLLPKALEVLDELIKIKGLKLEYYQGWDEALSLETLLEKNYAKDSKYGYTTAGPQRAELKIKIGKNNASEILSRGQQKLFISALKIAQGILFENLGENNEKCIYLFDDLPSELDHMNQKNICRLLKSLNSQVFITSVDSPKAHNYWDIGGYIEDENKLFHVKHGKIFEVDVA